MDSKIFENFAKQAVVDYTNKHLKEMYLDAYKKWDNKVIHYEG